MNLQDIKQDEDEIKAYIQRFKDTADDAVNGSFQRIFYTDNDVCWQLTSADKSNVYIGYFSILSEPNTKFRKANLRGLDVNALYKRQNSEKQYSGSALMHAGLDLPLVSTTQDSAASPFKMSGYQKAEVLDGGDFVSTIITLVKVQ